MCRMSQYDSYRRTTSEPERSLFAWLRELWSRRQPRPATAEVVPFPTEAAKHRSRRGELQRHLDGIAHRQGTGGGWRDARA
jgi:hypothetical protein